MGACTVDGVAGGMVVGVEAAGERIMGAPTGVIVGGATATGGTIEDSGGEGDGVE